MSGINEERLSESQKQKDIKFTLSVQHFITT